MQLFGQIVRTIVNVAALPVEIVKDATIGVSDAMMGRSDLGQNTKDRLEKLKHEAMED